MGRGHHFLRTARRTITIKTINPSYTLIIYRMRCKDHPILAAHSISLYVETSRYQHGSIFRLVRLRFPHGESMKCLRTEQLTNWLTAMIHRRGDLAIDQIIVKTYLRCIPTVIGIIDMVEMGPINGTQTHRTGLTRCIDLTTCQIKRTQLPACLTNGIYLGMGSRILVDGDAIRALSYNLSVTCDHSSKRATTMTNAFLTQSNSSAHQFFLCHCSCFLH